MLDATSKIPTGLLSLNFGEMGEFEQCVNIRTTNSSFGQILGKYCLGFVSVNTLSALNQTDTSKIKVTKYFKLFLQVGYFTTILCIARCWYLKINFYC